MSARGHRRSAAVVSMLEAPPKADWRRARRLTGDGSMRSVLSSALLGCTMICSAMMRFEVWAFPAYRGSGFGTHARARLRSREGVSALRVRSLTPRCAAPGGSTDGSHRHGGIGPASHGSNAPLAPGPRPGRSPRGAENAVLPRPSRVSIVLFCAAEGVSCRTPKHKRPPAYHFVVRPTRGRPRSLKSYRLDHDLWQTIAFGRRWPEASRRPNRITRLD